MNTATINQERNPMVDVSTPGHALAGRGLKPIAQLAADRDHGDRLRYMAGCRCAECRRANSAYESARQKARAAGDWNGFVPADKAREHLRQLARLNVGRRAVSAASDIAESIIFAIANGTKTRIRARTERQILAVNTEARGDRALIPGAPSWKLLNQLLKAGHSKAELARRLGCKTPALQIKHDFVTVRTAYQVQRLFDQLQPVSARKTVTKLKKLREEGYTPTQIEQRMADLARSLGEDVPDLHIYGDTVPAKTADLVEKLYVQMTE